MLSEWTGEFQEVVSYITPTPDTEAQVIGKYPLLDEEAALSVLDSSLKAYDLGLGQWPTMHPLKRCEKVSHFVQLMKGKRDEVAHILMAEIGKTKTDAYSEFDRTVEYIEATVDFYRSKMQKLSQPSKKGGITAKIMSAPRGIALCMGPYNYPLNETLTIIIPALLTGNVVIFKPPRIGVLLHAPILEAFAEAFPAGVVNTVFGEGQKVITPIMQSGKVDVMAFIGSAKVADAIRNQHPFPHRLHAILGLEAKNPAIIMEDADLEVASNECLGGALSFNGQRCTALKNIFVPRSKADEFVQLLAHKVDQLKLGAPQEDGVKLTPLPEMSRVEYLQELVNDAVAKGARVVNQNYGVKGGTYYFPAVLFPVPIEARIAHEEQFGPVIPVMIYDDLSEVINFVTHSHYGQQASIFTQNKETVNKMIDTLSHQVSRININSQCQRGPDNLPFTGRKDSAQGVLSIREALRAFSLPLVVAGKTNELNEALICS
ncbi:aldehyde dehydrogenase family protein [Candidatus Beckwithbacteria bacterium]|nr:aldehyde dehydrogenase family protein [Candidatus Beckwithbacteria bacterium]